MAPTHSARTKLSYPLYAVDFDHVNPNLLVVGGGGGYSSTGVANKISLLDTTRWDEVRELVDITLPKEVDSVMSLAAVASDEATLTAFAGCNNPLSEQKAGKFQHLRAFEIGTPAKQSGPETSEKQSVAPASTRETFSAGYFKLQDGAKNEAYQRVTRVSAPSPGQATRFAAVASSLAKNNELVILNASNKYTPSELCRVPLGAQQAEDVDFCPGTTATQLLAYCTSGKVYLQTLDISRPTQSAPVGVYETPESTANIKALNRPKLRSLRFLTPEYILLLQNRPSPKVTELLILKILQDGQQGGIVLQKRVNSNIKQAVSMDVCLLSASDTGEKQVVVAVAGANASIEVMTIDVTKSQNIRTIQSLDLQKDVHVGSITKICFSTFKGPETQVSKTEGPQGVKLASVGMDQNVIVRTFPLRTLQSKKTGKPRYVLVDSGSSNTTQTSFSVFMAIVVVGIVAFLLQAFSEIRGAVHPTLGATNWLHPRVRDVIARPYILADSSDVHSISTAVMESVSTATEEIQSAISDLPPVEAVPGKLGDLVQEQSEAIETATDQIRSKISELPRVEAVPGKLEELVQQQSEAIVPKAIVMRDTAEDLVAEIHHETDAVQASAVKKWDELTEHEQRGWKQRLSDAGHWSANQGDTVLKGIFFSELAGLVGEIVRR